MDQDVVDMAITIGIFRQEKGVGMTIAGWQVVTGKHGRNGKPEPIGSLDGSSPHQLADAYGIFDTR